MYGPLPRVRERPAHNVTKAEQGGSTPARAGTTLSGNYYQQHVYLDAVTSWLKTADVKSAPPYPGDILRHCRLVVEEMERDPSRRDDLYSWRDQVRALKS